VSYSAEPYAQFVDDLLTGLTGGAVREQFVFLPEEAPYRLTAPGAILPATVRVFGQVNGVYNSFRVKTDYLVGPDATIQWQARADGTPAADAVWPDLGTPFFVNFEHQDPGGAAPLLSDRNPGSITRLLAESFAREYAVLSRQLEAVYRAGFLDTATGRDLDQLAALVGVVRRRATFAAGSVVFSRSSPAPADIFINAGTRLSTAEPPAVVFETVEDRTLRRGNLSVEAPIQALQADAPGLVAANTITVIHRPILGIDSVANPQATRFSGETESDEALRARARRALDGAGRATVGALIGGLTTLPGLREKDIRLAEDAIEHPGVVKLTVALPAMTDDERIQTVGQAMAVIEERRPVGVRILSNIDAPLPLGAATPGSGAVPDEGEEPATIGVTETPADIFLPVDVKVELAPATLALVPAERAELEAKGRKVVEDFFADAGIGEILVYNRLVAALMAMEGVIDVVLEMYPQAHPEQPHRKNLVPDNPAVRPVAGVIDISIGGALVMLDVTVAITLKGAGLLGDPATNLASALSEVEGQLHEGLTAFEGSQLSVDALAGLLVGSDSYTVTALHYKVEYLDAGVRIHQQDVQLTLTGLERLWVRRIALVNEAAP